MPGTAAILRDLHRLRRNLKDLQDTIERLPRQLKAQQMKAARAEEVLKQAQDEIKKLKVSAHEKESSLKGKQQDIAKREKQRNEAVNNKKEYDALSTEIAAARAASQQLEDDILASLMETDVKTALLPDLEKALKQAKHEVTNFDQVCKERAGVLKTQLQEVQGQVKDVEKTLPAEMRPLYDRIVASKGEDAFALVAPDRICQACYTAVTAQMVNELMQGFFVPCRNCGRMLYVAE